MNLEELFQLKSPPKRPVLTPCTAQALLLSGTSLEDLIPKTHSPPAKSKSLRSEQSPLSPKTLQLRADFLDNQRMKVFHEARSIRNKLKDGPSNIDKDLKNISSMETLHETLSKADFGFKVKSNASSKFKGSPIKARGNVDEPDKKLGTMLRQEQQKLERMKKKQQSEIQQLLAFELQQAQLREKAEEKLKQDAKNKKVRQKLLEKKAKEREALKRAKMLMKLEQEKEALNRTRKLALEQSKRDKLQAEKEKLAAKQRVKAQLRLEKLRAEKKEKLRKQTEEIFLRQQMEIQEKLRRNLEKEKLRELKKAEEQRTLKVENEKKSFKIRERICRNREEMQNQEKKRLNLFKLKQEQARVMKIKKDKEYHEELKAKAINRDLGDLKRKEVLQHVKKRQEYQKQVLKKRQHAVSKKLAEQQRQKQETLELRIEEMRLKQEMKRQNVARERRRDEYRKQMLLNKIQENSNRISTMVQKKRELLERRKDAAWVAKKKREELGRAMDRIRRTKQWHKAESILDSLEAKETKKYSKSSHEGKQSEKEYMAKPQIKTLSKAQKSPYEK
eukprot:augustus_masked-scaffold_2-processed-gene-23.17-mRNA-1 protein AED:1.00 eAED:1.00 QI:0/-1/0/0/-1/1/1/0/559